MHRKLFYLFNFGVLVTFIAALGLDFNTEWRSYQKEYYQKMAKSLEEKAAQVKNPEEAKLLKAEAQKLRSEPLIIRQVISKDLGRIDRCITCHVGMDEFSNPSLVTPFKEHPFTGHPDLAVLAKKHNFQRFGCTSCHEGQGLATSVDAAHGEVHHWEKPMLKGPLIQASCAKCHSETDGLKGAEIVARGKKLFETQGCTGCHSIKGVGGVISVDLGNIADKALEQIAQYNFAKIKDEKGNPYPKEHWKLPLWIEGHLTNDPMHVVPNDPTGKYNAEPIAPSGMPDFTKELSRADAQAITAYLLSKTDQNIPSKFYRFSTPKPEPKFASATERGKQVYRKYGCAGCHGIDAKEGRRNFNAMGPGQQDPWKDMHLGREPTLPDTVGTFTRDELRAKIQNGVPSSAVAKFNPNGPIPPLYMPPWKDKVKGQELEDLITYLLSIAKKNEDF